METNAANHFLPPHAWQRSSGQRVLTWFIIFLTLIFCLGLIVLVAEATGISKTNNTPGSADNSEITRAVTFTESDFAIGSNIGNLTITVDIRKTEGTCTAPTDGPAYNREMYLYLTSPSNTRVVLVEDSQNHGGSSSEAPHYTYYSNVEAGGRVTMTFDDFAAAPVGGAAPTSGDFRPEQPLADFLGESPLGTWTLTIGDNLTIQPLCFYEFTLDIEASQPPGMEDQSFDVAEDSDNGDTVGTIDANDLDTTDKLTFSVTGGTGTTVFDVDAATGKITVADSSALDFETPPPWYTLEVEVKDSAELTATAVITLTETNVNEAPSLIALSNDNVDEHLNAGATVGNFSTTDEDAGDSHTYTLVNGTGDSDNSAFTMDGNTLKTAAAFDHETKDTYTIRVRSTDSGNLWHEQPFTITVNDANDPPTDIALSSSDVDENQLAGTAVGDFSTTDPNHIDGDTYIYALVSGTGDTDNGAFTIDVSTLKTTAVFDYESQDSYTIRVRSTDGDGLWYEEVFTISVNDANDAPTDITLSNNSVAENQPGGTAVGTFTTTDIDSSSFTYTMASGTGDTDNGSFTIVGNELRTQASFDFESKATYYIRVQTEDDGGATYQKPFTITVTNGSDAPTAISLSSSSINEHQPSGTGVGDFSSSDIDLPSDSHTYTLVSGAGDTDNSTFTIDGDTLKSAAEFDAETKSSYAIRVRSTDSGGLWVEDTFTITVIDGNDPPTDITLGNNTVAENQAGTAVGVLNTTDNNGGPFTYTLVTGSGSANNGSFQISGSTLETKTALDFEAGTPLSIRVRATDAGGLFTEKVFSITVTDNNDAPHGLSLSSTQIQENQPISTTVGTLSGTDQDSGETFTYTLISGSGDVNNDMFDIVGGNELRAKASFDYETKNSYSVRVEVKDSGDRTFEKSFTISVLDTNDPPSDLSLSNSSVAENQASGAVIGNFSATDDDAVDFHSFSLVSGAGSTDNHRFSIAGSIQLKTAESFNYEVKDSYEIRVQVRDMSGATYEKVLTITITDANDAPTAVNDSGHATNEDSLLTVTVLSSVLDNDTDPDSGDSLIVSDHDDTSAQGAAVSVNADGSFTYDPRSAAALQAIAQGDSLVDTFAYTARDSGGKTDTATVSVTVNGVNDAPTAVADSTYTPPAEPVVIHVLTNDTDPENDTLSVTAVTDSPHGSVTNNGDGTVTYTPDANYRGEDIFTYTVSDSHNATDVGSVTVHIGQYKVYMPVMLNNVTMAPDLVVTNVSASSSQVEVTIENQGNAATSSGFWVDFYVNPNPVPTSEGQVWQDVGDEGIVWGVSVPLLPGEALTLIYSTDADAPNLYYSAANSHFTGTLAAGTPVYAQVDSAHLGTTYGGVLELHEILGGAYNNVSDPFFATAPGTPVGTAVSATPAQPGAYAMPQR